MVDFIDKLFGYTLQIFGYEIRFDNLQQIEETIELYLAVSFVTGLWVGMLLMQFIYLIKNSKWAKNLRLRKYQKMKQEFEPEPQTKLLG